MARIPADVTRQFSGDGATRVLRTYLKLAHLQPNFEHWIYRAAERMARGEPEQQVMADYMYLRQGANHKAPSNA